MVPDSVRLAMAEPLIHHRTDDFSEILSQAHDDLKWLFGTGQDVLMLTASGTGSMEAVVGSVCRSDSHALVVRGGKFGERWGELCKTFGVRFTPIDVACGESVQPEQIAGALDDNPDVDIVFVTQSETSTGAWTDVETIASLVKSRGALIAVDAITGVGVHELRVDDWSLDVVVTGSQKGLMLPPGLALASLSEKAWAAVDRSDLPTYYLSLAAARDSWRKGTTPYTPAISLIVGLRVVLRAMREEGLEAIWARHQRWGDAVRAGVESLDLELLAQQPSNVHTSIKLPQGVSGSELADLLETQFGVKIAGGQDELKGKIVRIAHVGDLDDVDILGAVACLERALAKLGWIFDFGAGVTAAHTVLARADK